MHEELNRTYPNNGLSRLRMREIKEAQGYVGPSRKPLDVKVIMGGKTHTLEMGDVIGRACNTLIDKIYPALTTLIQRASSDSVVTLLQNIIITGGGFAAQRHRYRAAEKAHRRRLRIAQGPPRGPGL